MQIKKPLGSVAHLFFQSKTSSLLGPGFCSKTFYTKFSSQESNVSRELVKWIQNNQFIKNKYQSTFMKIKSLTRKEHFWAWFLSIQLALKWVVNKADTCKKSYTGGNLRINLLFLWKDACRTILYRGCLSVVKYLDLPQRENSALTLE